MEQVGPTIRKTLEAYRETLVEGRFTVKNEETGESFPAPKQDWAGFGEIKRYMLEKYKRKLGENREIQSLLYSARQFTSFEAYVNTLEIKMTNIKAKFPWAILKAIITFNMRESTLNEMLKEEDFESWDMKTFVQKAILIDDHQFTSGVKGKNPIKFPQELNMNGKTPKAPFKKRVAAISTEVCTECNTKPPCDCKSWNVAGASTPGNRRERTDKERARPPNPHTTQGKEFHKSASKEFCNYCKNHHCILDCPELWININGNATMPKNVLSAWKNADGTKKYENGRDPKTWEVRTSGKGRGGRGRGGGRGGRGGRGPSAPTRTNARVAAMRAPTKAKSAKSERERERPTRRQPTRSCVTAPVVVGADTKIVHKGCS